MQAARKPRSAADPDAEVGLGRGDDPNVRHCSWAGCVEAGEYRAPSSRQDLRTFVWFCLEHVREYNRGWNYFAGMNEREIEAHRRADTTWHRPSWRFGGADIDHSQLFRDPFGFFRSGEAGTARPDEGMDHPPRAFGKAGQMMAVLGLRSGFTVEELKRCYKALVKRHHPDLHGGDREAEERLKQINEAYTFLMAEYGSR